MSRRSFSNLVFWKSMRRIGLQSDDGIGVLRNSGANEGKRRPVSRKVLKTPLSRPDAFRPPFPLFADSRNDGK